MPSARISGSASGRSGSMENPIDISTSPCTSPETSRKRKRTAASADTTTASAPKRAPKVAKQVPPKTPPKKTGTSKAKTPRTSTPKRPTRYRTSPPSAWLTKQSRALTQPMFVLNRRRPSPNTEVVEMAGTTGNIYHVTVTNVPTCSCPNSIKEGICKHVIYVLTRVLKVQGELLWQSSWTDDEIAMILAAAPDVPCGQAGNGIADRDRADAHGGKVLEDGRKVIEEGDECPICCCEFEDSEVSTDKITWCRAACGNNVHKTCMDTWARMKRSETGKATCPFCRTEWRLDSGGGNGEHQIDRSIAVQGRGGYLNVADQLGLSGERDMSSYHQFWVRRIYGD